MAAAQLKQKQTAALAEFERECIEVMDFPLVWDYVKNNWFKLVHVPYFPAFHRPGWLLRYVVGPHDEMLLENMVSDVAAGLTVAMTLIPQALSYATLAGMPPVNGLYTAVIPSVTYTFFGSSMQLHVGPVALISLLLAELMTNYEITFASPDAVDFAGEAAVAVGLILTVMSLLNLGHCIRFISHPVMSGFTTAAAMLIGFSQLKNAFGFDNPFVPQTGVVGYEYNFQVFRWYAENWNSRDDDGRLYRNHYATKITFGLFIPLIFFVIFKNEFKPPKEWKETKWFRRSMLLLSIVPFIALIIGGHVAYQIKKDDHFTDPNYDHDHYASGLKTVGLVQPGLHFLRSPNFKWKFSRMLVDVIPMTLIAFMESYSVAQRIATIRSEMHLLNASQELWAVGIANFMSAISSAYPVAGSFSRSSLNCNSGAKTPLAKVTTMIIIILALRFFTRTFQYIPQAALSAVIWASIFNLLVFSDFWHSWKHSKKDFLTILLTWAVVFIWGTSYGLAAGIICSITMFLWDSTFSPEVAPIVTLTSDEVLHITLRGDLNFLTSGKLVDLVSEKLLKAVEPPAESDAFGDRAYTIVSSAFDKIFSPRLPDGVKKFPNAIVIDLACCHIMDITALESIAEIFRSSREKGVKCYLINIADNLAFSIKKYGIKNDQFDAFPFLAHYASQAENLPQLATKAVALEEAGEYELANVEKQQEKFQQIPVDDPEIGKTDVQTMENRS